MCINSAVLQVVTNLLDQGDIGDLHFRKQEEQLDLLAKVLAAGIEEAGVEGEGEDLDDLERGPMGARRTAGNMRHLSGAEGMAYAQFSTKYMPPPRMALANTSVIHQFIFIFYLLHINASVEDVLRAWARTCE